MKTTVMLMEPGPETGCCAGSGSHMKLASQTAEGRLWNVNHPCFREGKHVSTIFTGIETLARIGIRKTSQSTTEIQSKEGSHCLGDMQILK